MKVDVQGLILAQSNDKSKPGRPEAEPIGDSFLRYLDVQMATHAEHITPANSAQLSRIGALVDGVKLG